MGLVKREHVLVLAERDGIQKKSMRRYSSESNGRGAVGLRAGSPFYLFSISKSCFIVSRLVIGQFLTQN